MERTINLLIYSRAGNKKNLVFEDTVITLWDAVAVAIMSSMRI
jgi:hypothetical protein